MPEPRFTSVETFIIQSVRSAVDAMACIAILACIAVVCLAMGA